MYNDRPVKIVSLTISKTGKHGRARAHITALDIFNAKKYVFILSTSEKIDVPEVTTKKYKIVTIEETDEYDVYQVTMKNEDNEDVLLHVTDEQIIEKIRGNKNVVATVISFREEKKIVNTTVTD